MTARPRSGNLPGISAVNLPFPDIALVSVPSWACSPLSINNARADGTAMAATLSSVVGLIAFRTFAHAFFI